MERSDLMSVLDFIKQCQITHTTKNLHKLVYNFYDLINYNTLVLSFCNLQDNELQPVLDIHIPQNLRHITKPQALSTANLLKSGKQSRKCQQKNYHPIRNSSTCLPMSVNCSDAGETKMVNEKNFSYLCHRPVYGETATVMYLETKHKEIKSKDKYILNYVTPFMHDAITRVTAKDIETLNEIDLTKRQLEILYWAKAGKSNWEIAKILAITERTVKFHLSNIYIKLDVTNRSQAIVKAIENSIL